ncbi:MAG: polysaccharide pyruvyl transferase family protein [Phycisphaerae bacterium]|nr:polysaccharide pyruvyl transferase family protein [Phycisphaerae bacterium]
MSESNQGKTERPIFSAFAVSRTGNRGAVSMLESAIDTLTSDQHRGVVNVFTVYPNQDRRIPPRRDVHLFSGTPTSLLFKLIPLCCLYRLVRALRLPIPKSVWGPSLAALIDSDVCLLIGGTTFTDEQFLKVPYNVACTLPAIILGKRAMMYSQTIGPFDRWLNRVCAKFCLARMSCIVPRGDRSLAQVQALGFTDARYYSDSAFALEVPPETEAEIRRKYAPMLEGKTVVGVSVNSIVEEKCVRAGIDHNGIWADFIKYLQANGYFVLLIPHSMRPGSKSRHNNDLITVRDVLTRLKCQKGIHVVDEPYDCKELRVVVGLTDYYVTSRFHAMISALCTATPVFVMGWGVHKYLEVLKEFDLEPYGRDAPSDMSLDALIKGFEQTVADADAIRNKMIEHLPKVRASALQNHLTALRLSGKASLDERE